MTPLTVLQGCRTIQLTQGLNALVDDSLDESIRKLKWNPNFKKNTTYATHTCGRINGKQKRLKLHRLVVSAPEAMIVDHKNGDGLDNRRDNLRVCTTSENHRNRRRTYGVSKYKGVSFRRDYRDSPTPWESIVWCPGKRAVRLGRFATETDAARAYDVKARELFGEFACTNADIFGEVV